MASIGEDSNGRRRILFVANDGKRKTVRLGKMSSRQAEAIKVKVEDLVSASVSGHSPSDETTRWLATLDGTLRERLEAVGLVAGRRHGSGATLTTLCDEFFAAVDNGSAITRSSPRPPPASG